MRTPALFALVATTGLAAALLIADMPAPTTADPHAPLREQGRCPTCHEMQGDVVEPHDFVAPIAEVCTACHAEERLGRSHPYGVEPARSRLGIDVPRELPLEDGRISCGTCHQPHAEWATREPSFRRQQPLIVDGVRWYPTYFLRVPAEGDAGFTPLCRTCHQDR